MRALQVHTLRNKCLIAVGRQILASFGVVETVEFLSVLFLLRFDAGNDLSLADAELFADLAHRFHADDFAFLLQELVWEEIRRQILAKPSVLFDLFDGDAIDLVDFEHAPNEVGDVLADVLWNVEDAGTDFLNSAGT